ncbi:MAG TPA: hypothetical protein VIK01_28250 [Polyangiaceae bacterium]
MPAFRGASEKPKDENYHGYLRLPTVTSGRSVTNTRPPALAAFCSSAFLEFQFASVWGVSGGVQGTYLGVDVRQKYPAGYAKG